MCVRFLTMGNQIHVYRRNIFYGNDSFKKLSKNGHFNKTTNV